MKKLVKAELQYKNDGDNEILLAFKCAFPSLEFVTIDGVRAALNGDMSPIKTELKKGSERGRWSGKAIRYTETNQYGEVSIHLVVTPFVGDRRIKFFGEGYSPNLIEIDYSSRPSKRAAEYVIKMLGQTMRWFGDRDIRLFNAPEWQEE